MAGMMFLFLDLDFDCLPPADDVKSLCLGGIMPIFVPLCGTGGNDVVLDA